MRANGDNAASDGASDATNGGASEGVKVGARGGVSDGALTATGESNARASAKRATGANGADELDARERDGAVARTPVKDERGK